MNFNTMSTIIVDWALRKSEIPTSTKVICSGKALTSLLHQVYASKRQKKQRDVQLEATGLSSRFAIY